MFIVQVMMMTMIMKLLFSSSSNKCSRMKKKMRWIPMDFKQLLINVYIRNEYNLCINMFYPAVREYLKNTHRDKTQSERKQVRSLAWNSNGTYLASGDTRIKIWSFDGSNIKMTTDMKCDQIERLLFHETESDILASITKENVKIWDLRQKQAIRTEKKETLGCLAWHKDELIMGVKTNKENQLCVIDLHGGERVLNYQVKDKDKTFELKCIASDVDCLVSAGQQNQVGVINFLDHVTLATFHTLEAHRSTITACVFTPDQNYMLTGSSDSLVILWQLPELLCAASINNIESEIKSISVSHDSKFIAVIGQEDNVYIYSIESLIQGKTDPIDTNKLEGTPAECIFHPNKFVLSYVCYDKVKSESIIHLYGNLGA